MQIRERFSFKRASRLVIASMSLMAIVSTAGIARADDTKKQDDKNAKAVADSASKLDLSTPISKVKFYGEATVGYEATIGKSTYGRQSGMFSQLMVGTDVKLSKGVTMNIQLAVGQYPNSPGFFPYRPGFY